MTRYNYTSEELSSGQPIFLLDIEWNGITYYFARKSIQIPTTAGGNIDYVGNLIDFDFIESMDITGDDIEKNILSCAVIFDLNPLEQFIKGNPLEGSKAVFSYVIQKSNDVIINYEDRVILLTGIIQEPQYGDPLELDGFVSMSVEQDPFISDVPILDPNYRIDDRFPNRHKDTADGKPWPIVFGLPDTYSTPAYCVQQGTGTSVSTKWMIAAHEVEATQVIIQDDKFDEQTVNVVTAVDNNGNQYAQIGFTPGLGYSGLALPQTGGWTSGTTRSYWVIFNSTHGGSMLNPFGKGILTGGGDICRWALTKTKQKIDYAAWAGIAPLLNKFKFSGYINDPNISAWEWLYNNIIRWLPITVRTGPNGLTPVLNQLYAITHIDPVIHVDVDDNNEINRLGAIETIKTTGDLINQFSLQYAKRGYSQDYTKQVRVTDVIQKNYDIRSDYSARSINLYGVKNGNGESDYIFDSDTAAMVAMQEVARQSLPIRSFDISAPFHYGIIKIGDIISVTSGSLFMTNQKCLVVEKEWLDSFWRFRLNFEINSVSS